MDLTDMESPMVLDCVSPFEINPIDGAILMETPSLTKDPFKGLGKSVKLEMEEFGDLAPYLHGPANKAMSSSSIDELNTPIFERKGPFDFPVSEVIYSEPLGSASSSNQFDSESLSPEASPPPHIFTTVYNTEDIINNSDVIVFRANEAIPFSPDQEEVYTFKHNNANETPIYNNNIINHNNNDIASYKIEDYGAISEIATNEGDHLGLVTPEDSNSSGIMADSQKLALNLNFFNQSVDAVKTPDLIDSVVALEDSFNILDYVDAKDVTTVNIEDIRFDLPLTSCYNAKPSSIKSPSRPPHPSTPALPRGRKRKSHRYEDDDEDYVPPSEKRSHSSIKNESDGDDDDDDDDDDCSEISVTLAKKRNRREYRTPSVSSDHSDASKYRELRDKNNEASRKSRLKRKVKEQTLEEEGDQLKEKNIELKARVEELDKLVNYYRTSLFSIMTKK